MLNTEVIPVAERAMRKKDLEAKQP
jgi:hypothetical protein